MKERVAELEARGDPTQTLRHEVRELRLQVKYYREQVESRDLENAQVRKELARAEAREAESERKGEALAAALRSRQVEQCNMQKQIEEL